MTGSSTKSRLLPAAVLAAVAALATGAQAVAVNLATPLLPASWEWAKNPVVMWLAAAGLTALTAVLAVMAVRRSTADSALEAVKAGLVLRNNFGFQKVFGLHHDATDAGRRSSTIRWALTFDAENSGDRLVSLVDIEPNFPAQIAEAGHRVKLVRTRAAGSMTVFDSVSDWAEGNRIKHRAEQSDYYFKRKHGLPIHLPSGMRKIVVFEQEFELRFDGVPMTFSDTSEMSTWLGVYLHLGAVEAGFTPKGFKIPTTITTTAGAFTRDITYMLAVAGARLPMPLPEVIDDIMHNRRLGDLGEPIPRKPVNGAAELPPVARWLSRHGPIGPEGSRPWHHRRSTPTS
ncbi:hypothetical protein ACTG9Q_28720 [Actinokineospora sp. 24-640]